MYDYCKCKLSKYDYYTRDSIHRPLVTLDEPKREYLYGCKLSDMSNDPLDPPIVFASASSFPVKINNFNHHNDDCLVRRHKGYILLLGLAAGLMSLGSLWLYGLLDGYTEEPLLSNMRPVPTSMQDFFPETGIFAGSTACQYKDNLSAVSDYQPIGENVALTTTMNNLRTTVKTLGTRSPFTDHIQCSHDSFVDSSTVNDYISLKSRLLWIDASINCTHFSTGMNQLCLLCWLNMPDYWLFGPTLNGIYHSVYLGPFGITTHLFGFLLWMQLIYRALAMACALTSKFAIDIRPTEDHNEHAERVCLEQQSVQSTLVTSNQEPASILNQTRSAGDGAPAPNIIYSPEKLDSNFELPRASFIEGPLTISDGFKNLLSITDQQLIRNFFEHPSNNMGLSSTVKCSSGLSPAVFTNDDDRQKLDISAGSLIAKALNFLPNEGNDANELLVQGRDPLLRHKRKPCLCRTSPSFGASTSLPVYFRSDSLSSSSPPSSHSSISRLISDAADGFEYDELISDYEHDSSAVCNDIDEEEKQLLHLLDALSTLLTRKSSGFRILDDSFCTVNKRVSDHKAIDVCLNESPQKVIFAELVEKATTLTEDLNRLEILLDELIYKLQANQIQLEQAENNLDFIWYLRDNLEHSSDGSDDLELALEYDTSALSPIDTERVDVPATPGLNTHCSSYLMEEAPLSNPSNFGQIGQFNKFLNSDLSQSLKAYSRHGIMISSMPEGQLRDPSNQTYGKLYSRSMRYTVAKYVGSYRRSAHYTSEFPNNGMDDDRFRYRYSTEVLPDSEGFLHPDFTFESDGIIDWAEPLVANLDH